MKRITELFGIVPFLLITFFVSNIFFLSFISIFPLGQSVFITSGVHILFFILAFVFLRQYRLYLQPTKITLFSLFLCIPCIAILLMRFPLLYPTFDDLAFHIPVGDIANTVWSNNSFMPLGQGTFYYPAIQQLYTPFLYIVGIRLTIVLFFTAFTIWFISLHARFRSLVKQDLSKTLLDVVFLVVFCIPPLMGTHATLMVDFGSLLFCIEALFQFIKKDKSYTFAAILVVLSILVKQSTAIFFLPIFIYFLVVKRRQIRWFPVLGLVGVASVYFVRLFFETGNPLFDLLNGLFKSPLYQYANTIDKRWGPQSFFDMVTWPITGQFTERYGEIVVGKPAQFIFFLVPVIAYLGSLIFFVWKRKFVYFVTFGCFFFWSFLSGYSRYLIPLTMMVLILFILELDPVSLPVPKSFKRLSVFIFFVVMVVCLVSFKTDYSWRPYPSLATKEANAFFFSEYGKGLSYVGKDTIPRFVSEMTPLFKEYDGVIQVSKGPSTYVSYAAFLRGLPVVQGVHKTQYKEIQESDRLSSRLKSNLKQVNKWKKILIVVDDVNYPMEVNSLSLNDSITCAKPMHAPSVGVFERGDFFGRVLLIGCTKTPINEKYR